VRLFVSRKWIDSGHEPLSRNALAATRLPFRIGFA
jgi:hypothetical protein